MRWFWGSLCCVGLAWTAANLASAADLGQTGPGGGRCQRNSSPGLQSPGNPSPNDPTTSAATLAGSAHSGMKVSARERAIEQFDTDGDGQLSTEERQAARASVNKRKRQAAEAQNAPQYAGGGRGYGNNNFNNASLSGNLSGLNSQLTGSSGAGGGCMKGGGGGSMGLGNIAGMGMGRGGRR